MIEKHINNKEELSEILVKLANNKHILLTGCPNTLFTVLEIYSNISQKPLEEIYHYKKSISFFLIKKSNLVQKILKIDDIWETMAVIFAQEIDDGCAIAQLKFHPDRTKEHAVNGFIEKIATAVESVENETQTKKEKRW